MKILIVGAHPDDELLGCGGTLIKHISLNHEVSICIVTTTIGDKWSKNYKDKKIKEAIEVDKFLKIKKRYYCNLPTTELKNLTSSKLNDKIQKVIDSVNPDVIYTHFENDVNDDHKAIFNSVMVCTRPIRNKITLRCFETLSSTEWGNKGFFPNYYVKLNKEQIDKKIKAFSFYASELKEYPHPRSKKGIVNLAEKRGNEICCKYSEAFKTIKDYWL